MRVCQFRHDGKWTVITAAGKPPSQEDLLSYSTAAPLRVKRSPLPTCRLCRPCKAAASPFTDLNHLQLRVLVAGYRYSDPSREKYGVDESFSASLIRSLWLMANFSTSAGLLWPRLRFPVTVMHDFLRFRLGSGTFSIVYPVLINWITSQLQPGAHCIEMTSKERVERCSYPITVEACRDNQPHIDGREGGMHSQEVDAVGLRQSG
jgi:hypothetical protein